MRFLNNLNKFFSIKKFNKKPLFEKLFYMSLGVLVFVVLLNNARNGLGIKEGFEKSSEFVVKKIPEEIYDDFYVNLYDDLVFYQGKNDCELAMIKKYTSFDNNSSVLDIGSGTGHHVNLFSKTSKSALGIDISPSMVKKSKANYPNNDYQVSDAMNSMAVQHQTFTHITCLYFSVYYFEDKRTLFKNCYDWLLPGGDLILHLVDRDNFDPIIPAGNPFKVVSPQKYAKERITSTVVKFNDYEYKSNYEANTTDSTAIMNEEFKNIKNGGVRKNEHKLFIPTQKEILSQAKDVGFILSKYEELDKCGYFAQYIYVLQKPN